MAAAQIIHGDRIQLGSDVGSVFQAAQETELRFSLALLLADRSATAAEALGLRFVDRQVEYGQTYEYVISTPASADVLATAVVTVLNEPMVLGPPRGFEARGLDHKILLSWPASNAGTTCA